MCPDDSGVEQRADVVYLDLDFLEDALPNAPCCPPSEAVVHGLPGAVPLVEISPRNAGTHPPKDCVNEVPVASLRTRPTSKLNEWADSLPLRVSQFVSVHSQR